MKKLHVLLNYDNVSIFSSTFRNRKLRLTADKIFCKEYLLCAGMDR